MTRSRQSRRHGQRGLSLIELMVALVIGVLLLLGLVEVFAASRTAYQMSQGLARVQESGRFAMDFLQRDLRMAGHMGCVNDQARFLPENDVASRSALASTFLAPADQLSNTYGPGYIHTAMRFDRGVQAFDANGSAESGSVTITSDPSVDGSTNGWTPNLPADLAALLPNRVQGSDILLLRYFAPQGARLVSFNPGDPVATIAVDAAQLSRAHDAINVANPGVYGIADCLNAGVFNPSAVAGGTLTYTRGGNVNRSPMAGNESYIDQQATVYPAESIAYYVARKANGQPALFRVRFDLPRGAADMAAVVAAPEEVVEGVESLQVRFAQDSRLVATQTPTGNMGSSTAAGGVAAAAGGDADTGWRRVGMAQVGVLTRTPDPAAAPPRDDALPDYSALGVQFTVPADTRYRNVYEQSIALRNRLFGG